MIKKKEDNVDSFFKQLGGVTKITSVSNFIVNELFR